MKKIGYSETIAQAINDYLIKDEWHFSFDEKRGLFKFGLSLKGRIKKINYIIDVKADEYIVYAISPIGIDEVDKEKMMSMAEFVCRANYGLVNGNFELDMRDGEIRFKCFVDCEGITPTSDMIRNSIHCPAVMFERYGVGIVDIIFDQSSALEAVEQCEKTTENELRHFLSELEESDGDDEIGYVIARLAENLGPTDEDKPTDAEGELLHIKTNLFGTEGSEE